MNAYQQVLEDLKKQAKRERAVLPWRHGRQYPLYFDNGTIIDRGALARRWSWAIPSDEAIAKIVAFAPRIVEVGAGGGLWAKLLREAGADVIAYDAAPGDNEQVECLHTDVLQGTAEVAAQHPDRALMLCWPPYDTDMAVEALAAYQGDRLIYIGEGFGGCTANDAFFQRLDNEWHEEEWFSIPQYECINDYLALYTRVVPGLRRIDLEEKETTV